MYSLLLEVQDFEKKFLQTPEHQRDALLEQHKTHTLQLYNSLREKSGTTGECDRKSHMSTGTWTSLPS